ncbi:MAG: nucleotidyltransferase family protein [Acetobacterales bacterium]
MPSAATIHLLAAYLSGRATQRLGVAGDERRWLELIGLANAHMLGPTLQQCLVDDGRDSELPQDARDYLSMLLALNRKRNEALRGQAVELAAALNADSIRPVFLKGAIAALDPVDPLRDARIMCDLDILVPSEAEPAAVECLERIGYRVHDRYPEGHHAYGEFHHPGMPGMVDLHTELLDPRYILPAGEVTLESRDLDIPGLSAAVPSPTHRVFHHLLHAQVHHLPHFHRGDLKLNQLYEFTRLSERLGSEIDWPRIESRLAKYRLTLPLHSYLLSARRLFGMSWPLSGGCDPRAARHVRRCLIQLQYPALHRVMAPLGNLRGAFAWHRMNALYGAEGAALGARIRHAAQYLRKTPLRRALRHMLREV